MGAIVSDTDEIATLRAEVERLTSELAGRSRGMSAAYQGQRVIGEKLREVQAERDIARKWSARYHAMAHEERDSRREAVDYASERVAERDRLRAARTRTAGRVRWLRNATACQRQHIAALERDVASKITALDWLFPEKRRLESEVEAERAAHRATVEIAGQLYSAANAFFWGLEYGYAEDDARPEDQDEWSKRYEALCAVMDCWYREFATTTPANPSAAAPREPEA